MVIQYSKRIVASIVSMSMIASPYSVVSVMAESSEIVINQQPENQEVAIGTTATFTIDAASETGASLSYQWQYSTDGGKTWKSSSGATATTKNFKLSVNATTINRIVRCIVTASSGLTDLENEG